MVEVFEDNDSIVHINEEMIFGFISDQICQVCKHELVYFDKFDALFCPECNEWAEGVCGDPDCSTCKRRPEMPLMKKGNSVS
jgi:hypothetical protein